MKWVLILSFECVVNWDVTDVGETVYDDWFTVLIVDWLVLESMDKLNTFPSSIGDGIYSICGA